MRESTERDLAVADELGRMADARIKELEAANTALREQLAESERVNADLAEDYASALLKQDEIREQLAHVTQDRERLLRGDFTPEEFQNLCHNTDIQAGFDAFADGCEAYQQKMFGRCRTKRTTE